MARREKACRLAREAFINRSQISSFSLFAVQEQFIACGLILSTGWQMPAVWDKEQDYEHSNHSFGNRRIIDRHNE